MSTKVDRFLLCVLLCAGIGTRMLNLESPPQALDNEIELAKFVHQYNNGEIFVDPEPPLAKLVFYWVAIVWDHYVGDVFSSTSNKLPSGVFVVMRMLSAFFGTASVLLVYKTLRVSHCRPATAFFGALLVLTESSLIAFLRSALPDTLALFAATLVIMGTCQARAAPTMKRRLSGVCVSAVAMGIAMSVRHTAILTGVWAIFVIFGELWEVLGDKSTTDAQWFARAATRLISIIVIPLAVYLAVMQAHLANLPFVGPGSGELSSQFGAELERNLDEAVDIAVGQNALTFDVLGMNLTVLDMNLTLLNTLSLKSILDTPAQVHYGSTITIRHHVLREYLHSHPHNYLTGSGEQQVTLFEGQEPYNEWIVETVGKTQEGVLQSRLRPVKDGDTIRLYHKGTGRFLHVNDMRPPVTEHDYANEVSCNSNRKELLGDVNYEFKVRILAKEPHAPNNLAMIKLRSTELVFQLLHQGTKCLMFAHMCRLPRWAFGQKEVMCVNEPTIPNSLWVVESNSHPLLDSNPDEERVKFPPMSFWAKATEYFRAMRRVGEYAKTDPVGDVATQTFAALPASWPLALHTHTVYEGDGVQNVIVGNIVVYWVGLAAILCVSVKQVVRLLIVLNPFTSVRDPPYKSTFYSHLWVYMLGWGVHFLPYALGMDALPALYYHVSLVFLVMVAAQYAEYEVAKRGRIAGVIMTGLSVLSVFVLWRVWPLVYGAEMDVESCEGARMLMTWGWKCKKE